MKKISAPTPDPITQVRGPEKVSSNRNTSTLPLRSADVSVISPDNAAALCRSWKRRELIRQQPSLPRASRSKGVPWIFLHLAS
ncbi:hypothetical protein J6590_047912 [Homalodisca vitripennis]|nr:hypothetical protein J6590_047912 [Homalodisca vitripennis]